MQVLQMPEGSTELHMKYRASPFKLKLNRSTELQHFRIFTYGRNSLLHF